MNSLNNFQSNQQTILQLLSNVLSARCIATAVELDILEPLADSVLSVDALATVTETHSDALHRLLDVLQALEVVSEPEPNQFTLTPLGACLTDDGDHSIKQFVNLSSHFHDWWRALPHSVRTGENGFEQMNGMKVYPYIQQNPELATTFDKGIAEIANYNSVTLLDSYDFSTATCIVDVGGGIGKTLRSILHAHPDAHGILFDLPHVVERVRPVLAAEKLDGRCEAVGGSFLETVPSGGDLYIVQNTLNDWPDAQAIEILSNIRRAIAPDGRLLLIQRVLTADAPLGTRLINVQKLLMRSAAGGRIRTDNHIRSLFEAAGFRLTNITHMISEVALVEGVPA